MTCKDCNDTRRVQHEGLVDCVGSKDAYLEYVTDETIECPACARRCDYCGTDLWKLIGDGGVPLRDWKGHEEWCIASCLKSWVSLRKLSPRDTLLVILTTKDAYETMCGCDFPDGSHSHGCHRTIDELNDMAEAATEGAG